MTDDLFQQPSTPLPLPPAHHVESAACRHGWSAYDENGNPVWLTCDCEDPTHPWSPRSATDGPRDCDCYHCGIKPRAERGRAPCEYADHHCPSCHERGLCTAEVCR